VIKPVFGKRFNKNSVPNSLYWKLQDRVNRDAGSFIYLFGTEKSHRYEKGNHVSKPGEALWVTEDCITHIKIY